MDDLPPAPQSYYRELRKIVEVPVQRTIQVPETRHQVVHDVEIRPFPVRRLVEDVEYQLVEEPYTTVVEEPAVRMKQVWVPEHYTRKRTVQSTRTVRVPVPVTREVEEVEERPVPVQRVIEVPGVREELIDDIELVEITGTQQIEYVPRVGPIVYNQPPLPGEIAAAYSRSALGASPRRLLPPSHSPRRPMPAASWRPSASMGRSDPNANWHPHDTSAGGAGDAWVEDDGARRFDPAFDSTERARRGSGAASQQQQAPPRVATGTPLGATLADSDLGVLVLSVLPGGPLALAGVRAGDVITQADIHVIRSKSELRHVLRQKRHGDPMHLVLRVRTRNLVTLLRGAACHGLVLPSPPPVPHPRAETTRSIGPSLSKSYAWCDPRPRARAILVGVRTHAPPRGWRRLDVSARARTVFVKYTYNCNVAR